MRIRHIMALATALSLALALAACQPKGESKPQETKASEGAVLAVVNGKNITSEDFKEEAATLSPMAKGALASDKNKDKFLDNLVDKELIVQKAVAEGVDKDPEVVRRLDKVKASLVLGLYIKREVLDKVNVSDKDVKDYFDAHKGDLGSVRISHILVGSQAEAESILEKLKKGEDFKALAKQHSLDTKTKGSGGDLGYINWEQLGSSGLKDAAFKLKTGETSGLVQSRFGYHILKVTDKKPATDASFASMKESLKAQVADKKKEDLFDSLLKDMKGKAKITKNAENLKAVTVEAPAQAFPKGEAAGQAGG